MNDLFKEYYIGEPEPEREVTGTRDVPEVTYVPPTKKAPTGYITNKKQTKYTKAVKKKIRSYYANKEAEIKLALEIKGHI